MPFIYFTNTDDKISSYHNRWLSILVLIIGTAYTVHAHTCQFRLRILFKGSNQPVSEANVKLEELTTRRQIIRKTASNGVLIITEILANEKYSITANKINENNQRFLSRPLIISCIGDESKAIEKVIYLESLSGSSPKNDPSVTASSGSSSKGSMDDILGSDVEEGRMGRMGSGGGGGGSGSGGIGLGGIGTIGQGSGSLPSPKTSPKPNDIPKSTSAIHTRKPIKATAAPASVVDNQAALSIGTADTASSVEQPIEKQKDISNLVDGRFAYDVPSEMKVGKSYQTTVSITKSMANEILFKNLDSTKFKSEIIKLTSKVKVALIDPMNNANFSIQSLNTEEQFVDINSNTVWKWNVIPLTAGNNSLILRATVKLISDMGETTKDVEIFQKDITVQASPMLSIKNFVEKYWQWIFGTFLLPLSLYFYKSRKDSTPKV